MYTSYLQIILYSIRETENLPVLIVEYSNKPKFVCYCGSALLLYISVYFQYETRVALLSKFSIGMHTKHLSVAPFSELHNL